LAMKRMVSEVKSEELAQELKDLETRGDGELKNRWHSLYGTKPPQKIHRSLLIAAVARALTKHPIMNASWTGTGIRHNPEINISLAMAVKDGVVGAVIHKADSRKLGDISAQRRDLAERARANRLLPADISGGTFTISNLGMYQVDAFIAIITPPQAATLAVGTIADRVVPVKGKPAVRPMMTMTLSSDHRVLDGARAAEFLTTLAAAIQKPDGWLGE